MFYDGPVEQAVQDLCQGEVIHEAISASLKEAVAYQDGRSLPVVGGRQPVRVWIEGEADDPSDRTWASTEEAAIPVKAVSGAGAGLLESPTADLGVPQAAN
jgi:hypothetical protein